MDSILQNENKNRFNCPIDDCVYGPNGDKYFKREMILNQVRIRLILNFNKLLIE